MCRWFHGIMQGRLQPRFDFRNVTTGKISLLQRQLRKRLTVNPYIAAFLNITDITRQEKNLIAVRTWWC